MILPLLLGASGVTTAPTPLLVDLFVDDSANCAAGNGTAGAPFCTIGEAVAVAVNGDVIRIAAGTYAENLTLAANVQLIGTDGQALTVIDGGSNGTVVTVSTGVTVDVDGVTIQGGSDSGVKNSGTLTLQNSTVTGNTTDPAGYYGGGGIYHQSGAGTLTLRNCTVTGNSVATGAYYSGGGLYANGGGAVTIEDSTFSGNTGYTGGALFAQGNDTAILRSTFNGNSSSTYGVVYSTGGGNFSVTNTTISSNVGGGVDFGTGTCVIRSSTIANNDGIGSGAGIYSFSGVTADLRNTVVAGTVNAYAGEDLEGTFISSGHNLIGTANYVTAFVDGVNGDQVGAAATPIDPLLGPLGDNGGLTQTQVPMAGSPLVDAGDQVNFQPTDQRGTPRVAGSVDIGSTEGTLGSPIAGCTANPNSTGSTGIIEASGSPVATDDNLTLTAANLPPQQFGIFIASLTSGFVPNPGGSAGNLCLSGAIGRLRQPNQIQSSGANGAFSLQIPLTLIPQGNGTVVVTAGETWNFQAWHRDFQGGAPTSNFTEGIAILFN